MPNLGIILKLLLLILGGLFDWNKERKKIREEVINEVKTGLKNNDPSTITAALDRLR